MVTSTSSKAREYFLLNEGWLKHNILSEEYAVALDEIRCPFTAVCEQSRVSCAESCSTIIKFQGVSCDIMVNK